MCVVAFAVHMAGASMVIAGTCLQLGAHTPEAASALEAASAVDAFLRNNVAFRTLCMENLEVIDC